MKLTDNVLYTCVCLFYSHFILGSTTAFGAQTLLVGRQEEHPADKNERRGIDVVT